MNPQDIIQKLKTNADKIQKIGDARLAARNKLIEAEAALMDKEASIYKTLGDFPVTKVQMEIKYNSSPERLAVLRAKQAFQSLQDQFEVMVEVNNSLKAYVRVWETEIHSLNLQP